MADTLADLVVKVGADISGYTQGLQAATEQLSGLSSGLEAMGDKLGELAGEFLAFEGLKKLAEECIEASASIQTTTIALTALTGSASIASETIEHMESLANSEALSFPELLSAAQHMTAVGLSLEELEPALAAAGNAAWALGSSVTDVSGKMEGMALSGMASGRQLKALGLTSDDLGSVLGVTGDKAAKMFKALDEADRLSALTLALGKFGDVATDEANATTGSWINLKNAWHGVFVEIGDDLMPMVNFLEKVGTEAAYVTKMLLELKSVRQDLMAGAAGAAVGAAAGSVVPGIGTAAGAVVGGVVGIASNQIGRQASGGNESAPAPAAPAIPPDATTGYLGAAKAAHDLAEAVKAITDAASDNLTAFGKAIENLEATQQAFKYGAASADELKAAQDAVTAAFMNANPTYEKWSTSLAAGQQFTQGLALSLAEVARVNLANFDRFIAEFEAGNLEAPALAENLKHLTDEQQAVNAVVDAGWKSVNYLNDAYKALGLTMDGVSGSVSSRLITAFDTIAHDNTTTVDGIEQAWSKVSGAIDKLAKTDLPAAIAQYNTYISTLQRVGAPLADIYAAQEKELQLEIQIANQQGTSATKQIVALTNLQAHTQMLADASNRLGSVYSGLMKDFSSAFDTMAKGISSAIVQAQSFGQAWKSIVQSVEQSILNTIIGAAFGALKDAIITLVDKIFGIGATMTSVAIAGKAMASAVDVAEVMGYAAVASAAAFASTAAIPIVGPFLAPEAAALAYGTVAAMAPLAAFDTGGWVPNDMVAQIHAGEYIVPAHEAAKMSDGPMQGGRGGIVNLNFPNVKTTRQAAGELARYLKTAGGPGFSPAS